MSCRINYMTILCHLVISLWHHCYTIKDCHFVLIYEITKKHNFRPVMNWLLKEACRRRFPITSHLLKYSTEYEQIFFLLCDAYIIIIGKAEFSALRFKTIFYLSKTSRTVGLTETVFFSTVIGCKAACYRFADETWTRCKKCCTDVATCHMATLSSPSYVNKQLRY
jgi:hypothetical protein